MEISSLGHNSIDTFSPSNMIRCVIYAKAAANEAESIKWSKYASLTDRFDFQPITVETSGVFGESTLVLLRILGSRIASIKGDVRERTWLIQRISLAVVRGNAISIGMSCRRFFAPRVMIILVTHCVIMIIVLNSLTELYNTIIKIRICR